MLNRNSNKKFIPISIQQGLNNLKNNLNNNNAIILPNSSNYYVPPQIQQQLSNQQQSNQMLAHLHPQQFRSDVRTKNVNILNNNNNNSNNNVNNTKNVSNQKCDNNRLIQRPHLIQQQQNQKQQHLIMNENQNFKRKIQENSSNNRSNSNSRSNSANRNQNNNINNNDNQNKITIIQNNLNIKRNEQNNSNIKLSSSNEKKMINNINKINNHLNTKTNEDKMEQSSLPQAAVDLLQIDHAKIKNLNKIDNNKIESNNKINKNELNNSNINSMNFSLEKCENDDLVTLSNLNESIVLEQLKIRYSQNKIYTLIGDILIALNPLKALDIYGKRVSTYYQSCENIRAKLPPHVYATAEQCYREMIRTQQSQCILISGESGSGKTETCKYLVQHLLNRAKPFEICLNKKIEEVNSILESFGNARTRINHNSSRFGKYLEIYFEQDGTVIGAKFKDYLLEKSRIVHQNEYESTFHIFYLLFAGLSGEEKLRYNLLRSPKQYRFLSNTSVENCMSNADEEKFLAIKKSLVTVGFTDQDITHLLKILVCVLLIGEIQFVQKKGNNNDAVQVKNMEIIHNVCELLEMEVNELNDALISDVQITRGEEIKRERNMVQACDIRDALAKAFYGRLFSWIVNQINHHIQPMDGIISSYSIGLLDIFGFENFEKNSFEQMCINLANEQLHQLFTKYIFKLEIQECLDEQIDLNDSDFITYQDNQIILDLFLEKRTGIFALLDEESRFPKATDQSLAIKLHQTLTSLYSDVYVAPKNVGTSFHIVHYAGQVLYNVEGFLEKNRDFLPNSLFNAARDSQNPLVQELFQCKLTRKGTIAPSDRQSRIRKISNSENNENNHQSSLNSSSYIQNNNLNSTLYQNTSALNEISNSNLNKGRLPSLKSSNIFTYNGSVNSQINFKNEEARNSIPSSFVPNQYSSDKVLPLTVACHFKNSLHELIDKINKCKSYFIRCIKPNPNQQNVIINEFVIKQLRYCSLMHVCKIRKCGFPYRIRFDEFLKWYKAIDVCILKQSVDVIDNHNKINHQKELLERCNKCLEYAKITNYKIGKTKVFLRYWHIDILNALSKKLETKVLIAQKIIRGWIVRSQIKRMQQQEISSFFQQIELKSHDILTKLNSQRVFKLLPEQIRQQINKEKEIANKRKCDEIGINNKQSDLTYEINHTLEEFDSMLDEYDKTLSLNKPKISSNDFNQIKNQSMQSRSTSSMLNQHSGADPQALIHLVNNKNNKNDNTLKKRNALVAFEFKTLLDRVASPDSSLMEASTHQPSQQNERAHRNMHRNHSPHSISSTSSCSSTVSSSPATSPISSTSLGKKTPIRGISPSQLTHQVKLNNYDNNIYYQQQQNLVSKSQIITKVASVVQNKEENSNISINNNNNNHVTTIWREELNAKSNVQEQIKKQTELCQKLEDSKKNMPEWKRNLLKQKEMKKISCPNQQFNNNHKGHYLHHNVVYSNQNINETPELMKHNIFIKKGLATNS